MDETISFGAYSQFFLHQGKPHVIYKMVVARESNAHHILISIDSPSLWGVEIIERDSPLAELLTQTSPCRFLEWSSGDDGGWVQAYLLFGKIVYNEQNSLTKIPKFVADETIL